MQDEAFLPHKKKNTANSLYFGQAEGGQLSTRKRTVNLKYSELSNYYLKGSVDGPQHSELQGFWTMSILQYSKY
jgi:hypothetical protein